MYQYDDRDIKDIADEIIRYLRVHQNAADTLEGVLHWWVSLQRIEESKQKVEKALEYLCKHDLLTARSIAGGKTLFSLKMESKDQQTKKNA